WRPAPRSPRPNWTRYWTATAARCWPPVRAPRRSARTPATCRWSTSPRRRPGRPCCRPAGRCWCTTPSAARSGWPPQRCWPRRAARSGWPPRTPSPAGCSRPPATWPTRTGGCSARASSASSAAGWSRPAAGARCCATCGPRPAARSAAPPSSTAGPGSRRRRSTCTARTPRGATTRWRRAPCWRRSWRGGAPRSPCSAWSARTVRTARPSHRPGPPSRPAPRKGRTGEPGARRPGPRAGPAARFGAVRPVRCGRAVAMSPARTYRHLFTPLRVGPLTLANRIVFCAHLTNYAAHGAPTERHAAYYAARAAGGAGLIITEEHSTHPTDHPYEKLIRGFDPAVVEGYRRITRAVHAHGVPILAQLNHNGGQASSMYTRLPVWAPSPVPDPLFREVPKAVEEHEIAEVVEGYARTARHCARGGFDGVELQCSHSSIVRGFLSPAANRRTDRWGGPLENRARLLLELVRAVREAIGPDLVLGVRLCGDELVDGGTVLE